MKAEGDNLDTTKTTVRRLSLDIQNAICDEEDVIRNAIYEKLEAETSNDGDDCNDGPPPEISDFLKLTKYPLCRKIAKLYATCGDEILEQSMKVGRQIAKMGRDLDRRLFWCFILFEIEAHPVNFRDLLHIALRAFEHEISLECLCQYLNVVRIVAMRYVGVYSRMRMNMLLQYAEGFIRRIEINSISNTRQRNRINNSQRLPTKYVDIAVPVIAMVGTAFYFVWK